MFGSSIYGINNLKINKNIPHLLTYPRSGSHYFEDMLYEQEKINFTKSHFLTGLFDQNNNKICSGIFFYGQKFLHYHLSASDNQKKINGIFNLMIFESALHGKNIGLSRLHLGGGVTNDLNDKLLKFKKSMSTDIHKFYIGERINNKKIYKKIIEKWESLNLNSNKINSNKILRYHSN